VEPLSYVDAAQSNLDPSLLGRIKILSPASVPPDLGDRDSLLATSFGRLMGC